MGRRRIEMFQYRQVLVRMRAGDSVREIARSGLMGRDKLGMLRAVALQHGWLDANAELPDDERIAAAVSGGGQRASLHEAIVAHLRCISCPMMGGVSQDIGVP